MASLTLEQARRVRTAPTSDSSREGNGDPTELASVAHALIRNGLWVFPCQPGSKEPATSHGFHNAKSDARAVDRWWRQQPGYNPAIDCGRSGLVVIDEDTVGEFARFCDDQNRAVPDTFRVNTAHGVHWWFRQPEGDAIRNVGWFRSHGYTVDVRGDGGYVLAPGAVHPEGPTYTVANPGVTPAALPDWLADLLRTKEPRRGTAVPRGTRRSGGTEDEPAVTVSGARAALVAAVEEITQAAEGTRNEVLNAKAHRLGRMVAGGLLDRDDVAEALTRAALDAGLDPDEIDKTIASGLESASSRPRRKADELAPLDDSRLAEWLASEHLTGRVCWSGGMGWLQFDGRVWRDATDATVTEQVRTILRDLHVEEIKRTDDPARLKALNALHSRTKIGAVVSLLRGVVEQRAEDFDQHPDLLNVGNGVVDLRTGDLLAHNPELLLTKVTTVDYKPGATSPDWCKALQAIPDAVADWMQVRFGQAATGHMTPDDLMPVLQGNGSNGKSTVVEAIRSALGTHAVVVPERLLMANPSDHPTELTTLQGARLALIEETPEAQRLSVKRLKDTLGTPTITARRIQKDNVTWQATHSLILTTNYRPRINETDHGTWRRLALVRFPYTFRAGAAEASGTLNRKGDPRLRERLRLGRQGQHEAVLAWVVQGARRWYDAGQVMPPMPQAVRQDTEEWRAGSDLVLAYVNECLVFEANSMVLTSELYEHFSGWLQQRGHREWGDQLFTERFGGHDEVAGHGVTKERTRPRDRLSRRPDVATRRPSDAVQRVWSGVRFRKSADDLLARSQTARLWEEAQ